MEKNEILENKEVEKKEQTPEEIAMAATVREIRNKRKVLRQIDDLAVSLASGAKLDAAQTLKLQRRDIINAEIIALEAVLKELTVGNGNQ